MAINKVEYGGNTLIDITDTTATSSDVLNGKTFYAANGVRSTGSAAIPDVQINGTSIVSNKVADIITEGAYNSSTNKIATISDVPTNLENGTGTGSIQLKYNTSSGSHSFAEGTGTDATGDYSHAEGYESMASGIGSHAEGNDARATGDYSHAEGLYTFANSDYQHVEGKYNIADNNDTYAHIVGNGVNATNRSNAYTLDWSGNGVYAGKLTVGTGPTNNMDVATKEYVDTLTEKNMITATASDANVTTTTDSKYTNLVFNSTLASVGSKLTLNTTTGVITIGSGINYVKVSCGCYIIMNSSGTYHRILILKNGTQYGKTSQTKGSYSQAVYGTLCISNVLIPVTEGDTISAQTFCRLAGTYTVGEPYISVEAL